VPDWQDHYQILGIDRYASKDEIKKARNYKATLLHEDHLRGILESYRLKAEEELKKVNMAYEILGNPQRRDRYNIEWDKKTHTKNKTEPKPNQPPILSRLDCNPAAPQFSGSSIVWIAYASDPDGDPIYYRFWLKGQTTNSVWHPMTEWIKDNRWIWKTTSKDVGNNQIKVEVRDGYHADVSGCDDHKIIDVAIKPNFESHSEMNNLEKMFFNAASKRISDLIPQYEVKTSSGKLYRIDFAKFIDYNFKNKKVLKIGIELDGHEFHKTKEQRTNDAERQHNLELDGWRVIRFTGSQIYKDMDHCIDVTEQLIEKQLKDLLEEETLEVPSKKAKQPAIKKLIFDLSQPQLLTTGLMIVALIWFGSGFLGSNRPPGISSLTPSELSPKSVGSIIDWTTLASDPENDLLYYRYFLDGIPQTDWCTNKTWAWDTSGFAQGGHKIDVRIRDVKHAAIDKWDDKRTEEFILTAPPALVNYKPAINSLTSDMPSPQNAGTKVEWRADATDPESDQIYYKFWVKGPSTYNEWQIGRGWSISSTWTWDTSVSEAGYYQIAIDVRDGNHADQNGYDAELTRNFVLSSPPILKLRLNPDEPSPQNSGSTIFWRAATSESSSDTIYYRFLLKGPSTGDNWRVKRDWSAVNSWSWMTSSLDVGNNQIEVQARNRYSRDPEEFDSEETSSYTIIGQSSSSSPQITNSPSSVKTQLISVPNQPQPQETDKPDRTSSSSTTFEQSPSNPSEEAISSSMRKQEQPGIAAETPSKHSGAIISKVISKFTH